MPSSKIKNNLNSFDIIDIIYHSYIIKNTHKHIISESRITQIQ
jgi:hypothetical protein